MDYQTLPRATALTPGADLWIMTDIEYSSWARKIDWYVNFQFAKSQMHTPQAFSVELQDLIQKTGSDFFNISVKKTAPLMIATQKLLPNTSTLLVPFTEGPAWVKKCHEAWVKLSQPSVRFFLPETQSLSQFLSSWPKTKTEKPISFVAEGGL